MNSIATIPVLLAALLCATSAHAQQAPAAKDPLKFDLGGGASMKVELEGGAQFVIERNSFWKLGDIFAPAADYKEDTNWGELYVKPGLVLDLPMSASARLRSGLSVVATQTIGQDVFESEDEGKILLENAYGGVSIGNPAKGLAFDLSGGAQPYKIASGMLISDGGVDGFERGAMIFGPRRAWEMTGVARLTYHKLSAEAFHLNPRELKSGDSRTIINGARLDWSLGPDRYVGVTYGHVPRSEAPYVQAASGGNGPPAILVNGRDGLRFVHAYARVSPAPSRLPGLTVSADYARQWNDRIDLRASGGAVEIANTFTRAKWMPTIAYAFRSFSGDDPDTARLERFDPLFYEGSPSGWATGSNGSFVFINSNVQSHNFRLGLMPSLKDVFTLRYALVRANERRSPIQFGQATRPDFSPGAPGLVAGVTTRKLSDDVLLEYTRVLTPKLFLSGGLAISWPGRGIDDLSFGQAKRWTGSYLNIVAMY